MAAGDVTKVESIRDALRNWKPDLGKAPPPRDPDRQNLQRIGDEVPSAINREPRQPPFPEAPATNEVTQTAGTFTPFISLYLLDGTTREGDPPVESNKVLALDGRIDGQYPAGMGGGNYLIDLASPEDAIIYAGVTFNPSTLELTSRFLGVSGPGDYPESRVESATEGFLYWLLGFTYFDGNGTFRVWNSQVGDIYTTLLYGARNLAPALWAGEAQGWLDLDGIL